MCCLPIDLMKQPISIQNILLEEMNMNGLKDFINKEGYLKLCIVPLFIITNMNDFVKINCIRKHVCIRSIQEVMKKKESI